MLAKVRAPYFFLLCAALLIVFHPVVSYAHNLKASVGQYEAKFDGSSPDGPSYNFDGRFTVAEFPPGTFNLNGMLTYSAPDNRNLDGDAIDLGLFTQYEHTFDPVFAALKFGGVWATHDYDVQGLGSPLDGDEFSFGYGASFGYNITDIHGAEIEWVSYDSPDLDGAGLNVDGEETHNYTIGYVYRF